MNSNKWEDEDSKHASKEGWDLFGENGRYGIERDDDREVFADDLAALEHVRKRAADGCAVAIKALALDGQPLPLGGGRRFSITVEG